ncbi:MAG: DUF4347 domain-containing protein, partial [Thermoguttaceae bacterium]
MTRTKKLYPNANWWSHTAAGARAAIARLAAKPPAETAIRRLRALDCMELEDRMLFSAAPMAIAPHGTASCLGHVHPLGPQVTAANRCDPSPGMSGQHTLPSQPESQVVLIDSQLADSSQLIADVAPNTKVFVYNSQRDTAEGVLERVVAWAETTGSSIQDIAIVSHGVGGAFELGNQWITATSLAETAPAWQELSHVLASGANIEIFGCNVAAPGSDGQNLLNALASVTHAAVFASTDSTGAGGNWQLEVASAGTSPAALSDSSVPLNTGLLASYGGVLGTIAVDTISSATSGSGGASSLIFSHTVNSGSDSILIVEVAVAHGGANDPVASVTYGGQSLTLIGSANLPNNESADLWYLLAPSVGTANVVVNLTGSCHFVASATDYFGVNQTTPLGTLATATGNSSTPTVTVASAIGQLVVDSLVTQGSALSITPTGPGQIPLWSQNTGTAAGDALGGGSYYQAGGSTVTMSWSETGAHNWAIVAVPLVAAPVTTLTVTTSADTVDGDTSSTNALVANPGPDGKISLREAIEAADNTVSATPITIDFDIPGGGVQTINLLSALPQINDSMTLDAASQPGYSGTPLIQINAAGLGSGQNALVVHGNNTTVEGFSIYGTPDGNGIEISYANGAIVQANYVGLEANGTIVGNSSGVVLTGATNALIGGTSATDGNVISGNAHQGVRIESGSSDNVVEGNYIGTDPTGSVSAGNLVTGIQITGSANNTIGGTAAGAGNVISGNSGPGIEITGSASTGNFVYGNLIGTNASGTGSLGNSGPGVEIDTGASNNTIGGIAAGQANVIAYNGGIGVEVLSSTATGNAIEGNSIYGNSGLGIDLGGDGVTPNDPGDWDTGPNELQNYPVLASAVASGTDLSIIGALYTTPFAMLNYKIDFYWSPTADPSGHGQAQTYIGTTSVQANYFGNASINAMFNGISVPVGAFVTATATDPFGNTSEFALNVATTTSNHAPVLSGANNLNTISENPVANAGTLVSALIAGQVTDADPGALSGIAVTAVDNTNGVWQYSTNGGSSWTNFGSPSTGSALLLAADANSYVRFVPNANWNGTVSPGITFCAWDQTSGTAGGIANTTTNGGSTAFSSATASASITVNYVNQAPTGTNNTVTTLENTAYTFSATDFGFSDPNIPPNSLQAVKITTLPGAGALSDNGVAVTAGQFVSVTDINNGKLVFSPASDAKGTGYACFTFQVQNNGGTANGGVNLDPSPKTMTVNVTWVNQAPMGANNTVTTLENTAYTFAAANFGFSDPNDSPPNSLQAVKITTLPEAGTLTYNGVAVTPGQFVCVTGINNGKLVFTPASDTKGTGYASFTFQVEDNGGTANGGANLDPSPKTMTINVTWVNQAPTGANNTVTTLENTAYTFAAADFGFSDPNDTPPNCLQAVKITTLPGAGTLSDNGVAVTAGQFVCVAAINCGKLVFTPATDTVGTGYASFTFQVEDNGGTANGGVNLDPSPKTMTINVTAASQAPSGANNTVTTLENTAYTFAAADFGFSDSNTPPNSLQAVEIATLPGAGTLSDNGVAVTAGQFVCVTDINCGKLVFTPTTDTKGTSYASFTFQVEDNGGTADGRVNLDPSPKAMTVNVTWVNQAPAGANNSVTTLENTAYTFAAADFGFSDPNDSPSNALQAVKITTLPGTGTLCDNGVAVTAGQFVCVTDINNGKLVFTPVTNTKGTGYASFTFQVQDNGGTANGGVNLDPTPRTMTVNVTPVNPNPIVTVPGPQDAEPTGIVFSAATGNAIAISDAAVGNGMIQVTLTATNGAITLANTQGLTLGFGNGQQTSQIVMTGTVADLNAAMNGMLFRPTAQSAKLEIVADDLGLSGAGGPKTGSGTVAITQILQPPPSSPPVVNPVVPNPEPIAPSSPPQGFTPPAVAPAVPPVSPVSPTFPKSIPPTTKQPTAVRQCKPAAWISLDASAPRSLVQEWSMEIPLFRSSDSKTWTQRSARLGRLLDTSSSASARADLSDVAQGSPLWNDLNAMDQKFVSQVNRQDLVVGTALTVSTGFTVGYVIWMLRGGMLLTSLLAQMPAWRLLDPLV